MEKKKKRRVRCIGCEELFERDDPEIEFAPDPFAEEIHGDSTDVWECNPCRYQSAMDI